MSLTPEQREEVATLLNAVCDDVLDWADAGDTGARDVVNLIVNVFGARVDGDESEISEIIEANYDVTPQEVYSWCGSR